MFQIQVKGTAAAAGAAAGAGAGAGAAAGAAAGTAAGAWASKAPRQDQVKQKGRGRVTVER